MLEQVRQPEPVDLGPVQLDGLEALPDPFTPAEEQWAGEPTAPPSDDDRFGHLDAEQPPIPEGGLEGDLIAADVAWASVAHLDWLGAAALFDALESAVHRPDLSPGVHGESPFDVLPLEVDAARAHFVIVDQGAEHWVLLDGPFADFDAAFVPLHDAAKRFRRQHRADPDAQQWRYFVLAVPESLRWAM